MRFLVDTNVYLDLILDRENSGKDAELFFKNCNLNKSQVYITSMSLRDIGYAVHRVYHDQHKTLQAQFRAYEICSKVIDITADDSINSLFSEVKDYEDSLVLEAAKRTLVDAIITNNVKNFKNDEIPVITPKEYNKIIANTVN